MLRGICFGICILVYGLAEEPVCTSHFDYEYRTVQKLFQLEQKIEQLLLKVGQSVYVRWGRNTCPDDASLVYYGYSAGKKYADKGSGSDTVCLPSVPTWSKYNDGDDGNRGHIYGTETDVVDVFDDNINEQDSPCAVCRVQRPVTLMIPGRSNCYDGWKLEYGGYLMSAYYNHPGPHNYVCVDSRPEFVPNGGRNDNQHIFYLVEVKCGSLPCPPYVQGRELACVVCSKLQ
ncbi:short-chain collagen C4-like [Mercenaria mercenaria]|uniref:short-chain collagen C4-like n=1 Tax=Mercenaria mercenaria TaxID=6596 RepID=UPI00234F4523|nr:short-chain collagen C4-like [Mercenaria mercenaria]